jgi:hypothetical protein
MINLVNLKSQEETAGDSTSESSMVERGNLLGLE